MSTIEKKLQLANGTEIPLIALGTWQMSPEEAEMAVEYALNNDYLHIDTARTYRNEEGVGRGIKAAKVKREDFFLTTKVSAFSKSYELAKKDIEDSLTALDTEYVDLLIIHAPRPWDEMEEQAVENHYYEENIRTYII